MSIGDTGSTRRGKLRVYLGSAPGVGKTYRMLDEGWRRKERGTDVVIAYVETHGRPLTDAQRRDLETVPRVAREYRGTELEEMDLEAVLARHPEVALVDELAHTNIAGSTHEKRWEDVDANARRGHRRDHDGQHPASGIGQRRGRKDHRHPSTRDGARRGRTPSGAD